VIFVESGGNEKTDPSTSGAIGLMQVMPRDGIAANFQCPNGPCFSDRPSIRELEDPQYNVQFGSDLLLKNIRTYGIRDGILHYGPMDLGYEYADTVLSIVTEVKQ